MARAKLNGFTAEEYMQGSEMHERTALLLRGGVDTNDKDTAATRARAIRDHLRETRPSSGDRAHATAVAIHTERVSAQLLKVLSICTRKRTAANRKKKQAA